MHSLSGVISGIKQGFVLGPIFYIMLTNLLISSSLVRLPIEGFANGLNFLYHTA